MTSRAKERMDRMLAQLRIEEVSSCLRFVEISERGGQMPAEEATEWRRRLMAWNAFLELAADVAPEDVELRQPYSGVAVLSRYLKTTVR